MSNRHWEDISNERRRVYTLQDGNLITFEKPVRVGIKRVTLDDGMYFDTHVVHCADGTGGYVRDFSSIVWYPAEGFEDANDTEFGDRVNEALA